MSGIIEEFKRNKETKAILENIKEVVKEEEFYSIEREEMKEILQKRSFDIGTEGKLIKTLIHNIINKYMENGFGIVKYVECGSIDFGIESDQDMKVKETLIDILEELTEIPIIRETYKYLSMNMSKNKNKNRNEDRNEDEDSEKKENKINKGKEDEKGIFADWEKQFRAEEMKNKELEEQLMEVRTKYEEMKTILKKPAPKERKYPKKEIEIMFGVFERRDLKKAKSVLTNDPSLIFVRDEYKDTLLTKASGDGWIEGVELLLDLGARVDGFIEIKCSNGETPLIIASSKGKLDIVKYLIEEKGANIEAKNDNGETPLIIASSKGHLDIVKYLIEEKGANIEATNDNGRTPLNEASFNCNLDVVKYLIEEKGANIESKDKHGRTPLNEASSNGNLDIVKYLIEKGANIEDGGEYGRTPLIKACSEGKLEIIKYLIEEKGANIEAKDKDEWTPLIFASYEGHLKVVKYLIEEKGANIEAKTNLGYTPLMYASEYGHLDIVKYLIEKGANIEAKNNEGRTALKVSKVWRQKEVEEYLKSIGAKK